MGTALDENSLHYSRLVTHLKFLVHRCSLYGENTKDKEEKCQFYLQRLDRCGTFTLNKTEILFNLKHSPMGLSLS